MTIKLFISRFVDLMHPQADTSLAKVKCVSVLETNAGYNLSGETSCLMQFQNLAGR